MLVSRMGVWSEGKLTDGGGQVVSGQNHQGPVSSDIIWVENCAFRRMEKQSDGQEKSRRCLCNRGECEGWKEDQTGSDRWKKNRAKNDVPASSGVFRLLLLAYHGNDCLEPSHLGCQPQGLRFIKARRFETMEKSSNRERSCGERIRGWRKGGDGYRWCHSWCGVRAKRCPAATVIKQTGCWWLCCPKWTISLTGASHAQSSQDRHTERQIPRLAAMFRFYFLFSCNFLGAHILCEHQKSP